MRNIIFSAIILMSTLTVAFAQSEGTSGPDQIDHSHDVAVQQKPAHMPVNSDTAGDNH